MKLEKLTENKIRVILSIEDLEKNNITFEDFISNAVKFQTFFVNMLDKAEKELGFSTKDYKLLIESFSSSDEYFVFTITRFTKDSYKKSFTNLGKTVTVRKKKINLSTSNLVYSFKSFDEFCYFCEAIKSSTKLNKKQKIAKDISLYLYNNTYYLVFIDINTENPNNKSFYYYLSEFSIQISGKKDFNAKLKEHGKLIIKHNAITTGIKYFSKS